MKNRSMVTLLCLGWSFHVALLEDLMTSEDLDGSGNDLEHSGSGDWEMIISFSPPNIMDHQNSQDQRISVSSSGRGRVTKSSGVGTTPFHAKALSQGLHTVTSIVVDVEPDIVEYQVTPKPPAEEETWLPAITLQTMSHTNETGIRDSFEEDMESGVGAIEMSASSPLTTETERRSESVFIIIEEDNIIPNGRTNDAENEIPDDSDLTFDLKSESMDSSVGKSQGLLERTEVLAGVVGGGVVGLVLAVALVSLMVYRMKKKDEGNYGLEAQQNSYKGYQKAQMQEESLA
ncbi:syndecan-1-like [Anguilla anguilla]|uniref:syndecan-1-like n=1 Tax=Anguilla anguilla TaxID=7936 RepID=UPI0015AD267A|nr:syndecan-1-like [Anguilla anguilla]